MGTISTAFSLIASALDADQAALNVVGNNVASANVPGYTEETATWQENSPITINGVEYGTGVTETGATSVRDRVLEERLDQQQQLVSASSSRLSALDEMQALFVPASSSSSSTAGDIGSDINSFFDSFQQLATNPTNDSYRLQVISTAKILAGDISSAASALTSQRSALDQEANGVATQVNALTASIAQLNSQIQSQSPNADAGTLEDQRQEDLNQLSQLIGINQITSQNNGLSITTTSGQLLVAGDTSTPITTSMSGGVMHFFVGTTDVTSGLTSGGGELGGYLTARDVDIPTALNSLDQLAFGITNEVNAQNAAGEDQNGNAGADIFTPSAQSAGSAVAMSVSSTLTSSQIAAAGATEGVGDGSNATAMYDLLNDSNPPILDGLTLSDGTTLAAGQTLLSGQTPTNFYSGFVTTLGSTVSEVQTDNTAQNASLSQLTTQRNALSEVNLNDEAATMSTFERSYQAASQVFSMLDTIMASALNLGVQTSVS